MASTSTKNDASARNRTRDLRISLNVAVQVRCHTTKPQRHASLAVEVDGSSSNLRSHIILLLAQEPRE